jgi:large subunit ribosomal protein L19
MNILQTIEKKMMPVEKKINFQVGDTVKVHYKIIEGDRERVQIYEGVVTAIGNKGINKAFTVRKISFDIGVERVFPIFSPRIAKIEVLRKGKARRAKLYFLRERTGKATKLKEKRASQTSTEVSSPENAAPSASESSQKPGE